MEVSLAIALLVAVLLPYHQTGGAGGSGGGGTSTSGRRDRGAKKEDDSGPSRVQFVDRGDILNIDRKDFDAIADELLAHWENNIRVLKELHITTAAHFDTPSCKITLNNFKVQGTSQRSSTIDTPAEVVWVKVVEKNFGFCAIMEMKPKTKKTGGCIKGSSEVCLQPMNGMQLAYKLWFDNTHTHKIQVNGLKEDLLQVNVQKRFGKGKAPEMEDEGWTKARDALSKRLVQHLAFSILNPIEDTLQKLKSAHATGAGPGVQLMKATDIESIGEQ